MDFLKSEAYRNWIYLSLLLIGFSACKRQIDVDIADPSPGAVLIAELNSDSLIKIRFSLTQSILKNAEPDIINSASIDILDADSNLLETITHYGSGFYRSSVLKPEYKKKYLFRIHSNSRVFSCDETMPDSISATLKDTGRVIFQGIRDFFQMKVNIADHVSDKNYYAFRVKRHYKQYSGTDTIQREEWMDISSVDIVLTENPLTSFSEKFIIFDDRYFNGFQREIEFGVGRLFRRTNQKTESLELMISTLSESAYHYYTSVNEHLYYQNDPFAQPTLLNGNVDGALGAIVGMNTKIIKIKIP